MLTSRVLLNLLLVLCLTAWAGCGGCNDDATPDDEPPADDLEQNDDYGDDENDGENGEPESFADAMNQLNQALGGGESVDPVDFRDLKELMPDDFDGWERSELSGERSGAMGIKISQAQGTYQKGDQGQVTLRVMDMGTMKGMATMGLSWLMLEIDREDENGFERTTKFKGYPAFQKFERNGDRLDSEMQLIVGERFVVSGEGPVEMDVLEEGIEEIGLRRLEKMKNVGVEE